MLEFVATLLAGATAGFTVDVALYPLDTIKTRLQAPEGFLKAGGFKGVYSGLGAVAIGSAPGAALFFCTYEYTKKSALGNDFLSSRMFLSHMMCASVGEFMACLIRVPTEVLKLHIQTGRTGSIRQSITHVISHEGFGGFFKGFSTTIMREIPFSAIQFPLLELMKSSWADRKGVKEVSSFEAAVCGSITGAFAAALTTPLDVAKTRLMLGSDTSGVAYRGTIDTLIRLYYESGDTKVKSNGVRSGGFRVLFSGVGPRTTWMGLGGFVFFGAYEASKKVFM